MKQESGNKKGWEPLGTHLLRKEKTSKMAQQSQNRGNKKQRVMGIEPTYTAWKAVILPLNYTRNGVYYDSNNEAICQ